MTLAITFQDFGPKSLIKHNDTGRKA